MGNASTVRRGREIYILYILYVYIQIYISVYILNSSACTSHLPFLLFIPLHHHHHIHPYPQDTTESSSFSPAHLAQHPCWAKPGIPLGVLRSDYDGYRRRTTTWSGSMQMRTRCWSGEFASIKAGMGETEDDRRASLIHIYYLVYFETWCLLSSRRTGICSSAGMKACIYHFACILPGPQHLHL